MNKPTLAQFGFGRFHPVVHYKQFRRNKDKFTLRQTALLRNVTLCRISGNPGELRTRFKMQTFAAAAVKLPAIIIADLLIFIFGTLRFRPGLPIGGHRFTGIVDQHRIVRHCLRVIVCVMLRHVTVAGVHRQKAFTVDYKTVLIIMLVLVTLRSRTEQRKGGVRRVTAAHEC